jgi:hypothetical protein
MFIRQFKRIYKILISVIFILVLISILVFLLFSESIYGYVYRNNGNTPLPFFVFKFEGKTISTDNNGMFKIRIFPKRHKYSIEFFQKNSILSNSSDLKKPMRLYVSLPPVTETKKGEVTLGERTWGFDFVGGITRRAGFTDEIDISFIAQGGEDIFGNKLEPNTIIANWVADAGIIHMGRIPLDKIDFAPIEGYNNSAPLVIGDSYCVYCHMGKGYAKFQILEGDLKSIPGSIKLIYEYQPDGSNRFR